jgi:hypothetical protein
MTISVEERTLRANWFNVSVAFAALVVATISLCVSCNQLSETKKINDVLLATRASNVFFDSQAEPNGAITYILKNRNKEPVLDAYYTYRVGDARPNKVVFLGVVAACSSVQLVYPERHVPLDLYLKDHDGNFWHREASGRVQRVEFNKFRQDGRDVAAAAQPIEGGC